MSSMPVDRRRVLVGAGALGAAVMLPSPASAKGSVTAAIYPGTWDEAYRSIVAPALKKAKDVDLALEPLFAVDQIAKAQAARGAPPFDAFVLDPGPRASAIERGLFDEELVPEDLTVVRMGKIIKDKYPELSGDRRPTGS